MPFANRRIQCLAVVCCLVVLSACQHTKKIAKTKQKETTTVQKPSKPVLPEKIQGILNAIHANE